MAEAARPNQISGGMLEAFLDRYAGLEEEKVSIMMAAVSECKRPTALQRELKKEMKEAGIRIKTFNIMWDARRAEMKLKEKIEAMSDDEDFADDYEQLKECAAALGDTPFGDYLNGLISA